VYKILLVDDEMIVREALKVIIGSFENVSVSGEANSGKDAIELFDLSNPDMIFVDIKIPGIDILYLIKYMKRINEKSKVILLTDYGSTDNIFNALEIGADGYLSKPYRQRDIYELVNLHLQDSTYNDYLKEPYSNSEKKVIQSVLDFIDRNFEKGVTLEEAAEHVHLNPFYLSKLFKKELNINFVNYVMERKMDKAKVLLESTDLSILNIAMELNYQESNYFSKVFKKVVGITPSDYRKEKQSLHSYLLKKNTDVLNGNWYV
jgi:two-component system, response regulator YesN